VTNDQLLLTKAELRTEMAGLRAEISEVRVEIANLASELRKEMRDQTRWLTGVLLVAMTLTSAIARFA
jgi:cell division protein FtsB